MPHLVECDGLPIHKAGGNIACRAAGYVVHAGLQVIPDADDILQRDLHFCGIVAPRADADGDHRLTA